MCLEIDRMPSAELRELRAVKPNYDTHANKNSRTPTSLTKDARTKERSRNTNENEHKKKPTAALTLNGKISHHYLAQPALCVCAYVHMLCCMCSHLQWNNSPSFRCAQLTALCCCGLWSRAREAAENTQMSKQYPYTEQPRIKFKPQYFIPAPLPTPRSPFPSNHVHFGVPICIMHESPM